MKKLFFRCNTLKQEENNNNFEELNKKVISKMWICQSQAISNVVLINFMLVFLIKTLIVQCQSATTPSPTSIIRISTANETISEMVITNGNNTSSRVDDAPVRLEKIAGKLIYAKTYDQALLDKILNKSDTYYKKCSCVPVVAADVTTAGENSSSKVVAFVQPSLECVSVDEFSKCAKSLNAYALLVYDQSKDINQNIMILGKLLTFLDS